MLKRPSRLCLFAVLLSLWPCVAVSAHPAWGICVDAAGAVYFSDAERSRVWKITWRGSLVELFKGKHSHDLFLDTHANLYGEHVSLNADTGKWQTTHWRFNSDAKLTELGEPLPGVGLVRDAAGNQYGVERAAQTLRLFKRAPNGQLITLAGGARGHADGVGAQAQFTDIEAIVLGSGAQLYVRDYDCIRQVGPDGAVTTLGGKPLAGVPRANPSSTLGLAADRYGNVFVADTEHGVVRKLSAGNRVETVLQTGWFWSPTGVAVGHDGLYVLEAFPHYPMRLLAVSGVGPYLRVQKLTADGRVQTLAIVWGTTTRLLLGAVILLGALVTLWRLRRREMLRGMAA